MGQRRLAPGAKRACRGMNCSIVQPKPPAKTSCVPFSSPFLPSSVPFVRVAIGIPLTTPYEFAMNRFIRYFLSIEPQAAIVSG